MAEPTANSLPRNVFRNIVIAVRSLEHDQAPAIAKIKSKSSERCGPESRLR